MYSRRPIRAIVLAALSASLALPAGPALALLVDPVFSVAYGLNTTNAPLDVSVKETAPVSRSADVVSNSVFGTPNKRVTVSTNADRGQIKTLNKMSISSVFSPNRSEAASSFLASVFICGAGSVMTCVDPNISDPIPIPYPNISRTTNFTFDNAEGSSRVEVKVNSTTVASERITRQDGDEPGTLKETVKQKLTQPDGSRLTGLSIVKVQGSNAPLAFSLAVSTESVIGCSVNCSGTIDETQTVSFVEDEPAFLGLPDGLTIFAPELNIFNNRWTPPGSVSPPGPVAVSEPATLPLVLSGLLFLGLAARRSRMAGTA